MSRSHNLSLPLILASQAQKHVVYNESIQALDAIVQLSVRSRSLTEPPVSPEDGARYLIAQDATGDWAGSGDRIGIWQDGAWTIRAPVDGWIAWVSDEERALVYDGTRWQSLSAEVNPTPLVGVNGEADATNRLTVKSNAVLLSHDDTTPGTSDLRLTLNKQTSANTVSAVFQTGYSGRAEFGLAGNDDWQVKVSADGNDWIEAMRVDRETGLTTLQGLRHAATGERFSSLLFTPGGDGITSIYRIDGTTGENPRNAVVQSVSEDLISLSGPDAYQFFHPFMENVSYIRIWNTSRTPPQPAWLRARPTDNDLSVTDPDDIANWASGDTIQVGDPGSGSGYNGKVFALDISPMLVRLFGTAFRQRGIAMKCNFISGKQNDSIAVSPTGLGGSFAPAVSVPVDGGSNSSGTTIVPCTELSPISDSNLLLVREKLQDTGGIRLLSSMAVFD